MMVGTVTEMCLNIAWLYKYANSIGPACRLYLLYGFEFSYSYRKVLILMSICSYAVSSHQFLFDIFSKFGSTMLLSSCHVEL